ncbi:MAG: DUF4384 domain-containing protein, partial [Candidatus Hodarchaeota archaeon]
MALLFFSGHGSYIPDYNNDEKDGKDEVLCPYDMIPQGGYNIIVDDELGLWLEKLKGRTTLVIVDACHSGGVLRSVRTRKINLEYTPSRLSRFIPITDYNPPRITRSPPKGETKGGTEIPQETIFMSAAAEHEVALEVHLPQGFHGGFTYGLCEAMYSLHNASYNDLFAYARSVVKDRLILPQEPQLIGSKDIIITVAFDLKPADASLPSLSQPLPLIEIAGQQYSHALTEQLPVQKAIAPSQQQPPVKPPEIVSDLVMVAIEPLQGASGTEIEKIKDKLRDISIAQVVEENAFFDKLIRGTKDAEGYHVRLVNPIGDIEKISSADTIDELINNLNRPLEYAYVVKMLASLHHPQPTFKVSVKVTDETRRDFNIGEEIIFQVESERDCYILLINLASDGLVNIIFPNRYQKENHIKANIPLFIPDKKDHKKGFDLQFTPPAGEEIVKVIATNTPLDLKSLNPQKFKGHFLTFQGESRSSLIQKISEKLSQNNFPWSEDTVVVRSHNGLLASEPE